MPSALAACLPQSQGGRERSTVCALGVFLGGLCLSTYHTQFGFFRKISSRITFPRLTSAGFYLFFVLNCLVATGFMHISSAEQSPLGLRLESTERTGVSLIIRFKIDEFRKA